MRRIGWALCLGVLGCAASDGAGKPDRAQSAPLLSTRSMSSARAAPAAARAATATSATPALSSAPAVELTVLFTSDEHGWILPHEEKDRRVGGASALLAKLVRDEQHCAGVLAPDDGSILAASPPSAAPGAAAQGAPALPGPGPGAPESSADPCAQSHTLLLSGGDNYTGPAISSHFGGATMAVAMGRLGYVASAFGNHELDFGRDKFAQNRARAHMRYVAANLVGEHGSPQELAEPYVIVKRAGAVIGVVGLATPATLRTALASRFAGVVFEDEEQTLARVVPELWSKGVDAVLLLAHDCAAEITPMIERHPEWQLSFVGTGHCHEVVDELVGAVPVMSPGWRLDHYARVRLRIEHTAAGPHRAALIDHELRDVSSPVAEPAPSGDPALDERIASWQAEVDRVLGEVIGYSATGIKRSDPELGAWVVDAWRTRLHADVAVTSRGSLRQDMLPGPIRLVTVQDIMPFENELVVAHIPGSALLGVLRRKGTIASGARRDPDGGFRLSSHQRIDPNKVYSVVTTDFLYAGGDDYPFQKLDPAATVTGIGWRVPVIEATKALHTNAKRPLEALVRAAAATP